LVRTATLSVLMARSRAPSACHPSLRECAPRRDWITEAPLVLCATSKEQETEAAHARKDTDIRDLPAATNDLCLSLRRGAIIRTNDQEAALIQDLREVSLRVPKHAMAARNVNSSRVSNWRLSGSVQFLGAAHIICSNRVAAATSEVMARLMTGVRLGHRFAGT
jgi:hypothetical protein